MSDSSENGAPSIGGLLRGRTLRLFLLLAFMAAAGGGLTYAWRTWGDPLVHGPRYSLSADDVQVTPLPDWIRSDVVGEVIRSGSLEGESLLDPQLTIKVADAFRLHPWVREVQRVTKRYPSEVQVALEYRRPVALVEVVAGNARGVLPIDGESVLLPREDFIDEQGRLLSSALAYPVIVAGDAMPLAQPGSPWGDPRVYDAAKIATVFGDEWPRCGLFKILPPSPSDLPAVEAEYILLARNGSQIRWGSAPGDSPGEQSAAREKVERLVQFAADGALNEEAAAIDIDLRNPGDLRVGPATAQRP